MSNNKLGFSMNNKVDNNICENKNVESLDFQFINIMDINIQSAGVTIESIKKYCPPNMREIGQKIISGMEQRALERKKQDGMEDRLYMYELTNSNSGQ
jgi:hypothetical protein